MDKLDDDKLNNEELDDDTEELDDDTEELDNEIKEFEDLTTPISKYPTVWFPWHGRWKSMRMSGYIFWGKISILLQKDPLGIYETKATISSKGLNRVRALKVPIYVNQQDKNVIFTGDNNGHTVVFTANRGISKKTKRPKLSGKYRSDNPYDLGKITLKIDRDFWEK